jgi:hypothetical protein
MTSSKNFTKIKVQNKCINLVLDVNLMTLNVFEVEVFLILFQFIMT